MPEYCEVALPVPLDRAFTYSIPAGLSVMPGMRVLAPFGPRMLVGVVLRHAGPPRNLSPDEIKPIRQTIDDTPAVSDEFLRLSQWVAQYYLVPQGEVLAAMLPLQAGRHQKNRVVLTDLGESALASADENPAAISTEEAALLKRISKRGGIRPETLRQAAPLVTKLKRKGWLRVESSFDAAAGKAQPAAEGTTASSIGALPFELTREQSVALARIQDQLQAGAFGVILLHGVTGSGKTEVYMRTIELALARGRSALMLLPEINLTPAMTSLFAERFGGRVAVLHSGFSDQEREAQWRRVREGGADIVIGTRSAVFAPLDRPGLIIVDEEHDGSYKQEEAPRYNGRDVAIVRGQQTNATVVLGSATPAIESRYHAETGKYQLLELEARVQERPLPDTEVVDMRQEFAETGRQSFLSRRLNEEIARRLSQREQILILLNRRGYSAFVLCRSCGKAIECENCSIALTHHRRMGKLMCHYCGFTRPVPRVCPQCSGEHLYFMGQGSERIEETLHSHFPEARIGRLDRDTARGHGKAESILASFREHELDILVGTQMIAKGHDIHKVTLVGVINADIGLALPDFRASERTFQLLTQVAGRAGRGELPGEVIIQTYYPDHYAIKAAAAQDYSQFYKQELHFREVMRYPPFSALANVLVKGTTAEAAMKLAGRLGRHLESLAGRGCNVLGPAAAPIPRLKRSYRYHFLLKAARRSSLRKVLESCREFAAREKFPATSLIIDVDPQSLL